MEKNKLVGLVGALAVATLLLLGHLLTSSEPETPLVDDGPAVPAKAHGQVPDAETILAEIAARRQRESTAGIGPSQTNGSTGPKHSIAELPAAGGLAALVGLSAEGFQPVNFEVRASSLPAQLPLSRTPPDSIHTEPRYAGDQQWYGVLKLGSPLRNFPFVLDLTRKQQFQMWFDANANGDLTDDPGPLTNKSSWHGGPGGFATLLQVPWELLAAQAGFRGNFKIWFYSNKSNWERGRRASHYSRTQLKGEATVNGRRYQAWVADSGYNDADLTNDGLLVDLNGNGKADADEWFADARADGKRAARARGRVQVRW